jgi:UDP-N-acetyl-D-galactosamine dehydrogenase
MTDINQRIELAIIGLGYVGLPLALEFSKKRKVIGFDIDKNRIKNLKKGIDQNFEFKKKNFANLKKLTFTNNKKDLKTANCFIITVPTPVDKLNKPDLKPLLDATKMVGKILKRGNIVIFESTVYPGCIEEVCVPILEKYSNLYFNNDFFCGYSPERINPGDKKHKISNIKKITSGSSPEVLRIVDKLYNEIVLVGTYKAESIKVAEAAKVIENTQRDLNIALINELSMLFSKMNIDTKEVLSAAATKWNFLRFEPGLVGGHCIGVDPYYLTYKAKEIGYSPKIILAGRKINDGMGNYIVSQLSKIFLKKRIEIKNSRILILGFSFKENCTDHRNTKVLDIVLSLKKLKAKVDIIDPLVDKTKVFNEYKIKISNNTKILKKKITTKNKNFKIYDSIILTVKHDDFKGINLANLNSLCKTNHVICDLKSLLPKKDSDFRL